jgi:hypothetical protein
MRMVRQNTALTIHTSTGMACLHRGETAEMIMNASDSPQKLRGLVVLEHFWLQAYMILHFSTPTQCMYAKGLSVTPVRTWKKLALLRLTYLMNAFLLDHAHSPLCQLKPHILYVLSREILVVDIMIIWSYFYYSICAVSRVTTLCIVIVSFYATHDDYT